MASIWTIYATGLGDVVDGVPVPAGTSAPLDRPILLNNKVSVVVGGVEIDPAFARAGSRNGWVVPVQRSAPGRCPAGPAVPMYVKVILVDGTIVESNKVTVVIVVGATQ